GVRSELAADPALLVATERVVAADHVPVVDPHGPRLDLRRDLERTLVVGAPHARRQPVLGVVGDPDRLVTRGVLQHADNRAEDLLARDLHVVRHVREDRRTDPEAPLETGALGRRAPERERRSLLLAGLDVAENALLLLGRDHRTEIRAEVRGVADDDRLRALD